MVRSWRAMTYRNWIVAAVLAFFVARAISTDIHHLYATYDELLDLQIYRAGGEALLDGFPLYSIHYHVLNLPFTYTPFAAIVFVPFARLLPHPAAIVWTALSTLALLRVCWLLAREMRPRVLTSFSVLEQALALFLIGLVIEPVIATFGYGQINLVIMWLIVEDLLRRKPNRWDGSLIGLATGIKLVPAVFIVFLFATRRVREGLQATAVFLATVAAGFVVQPGQAWSYWTGIAYDPARVGGVAYVSNQSLNGVITRLTHGGNRPLWLLLSAVVLVVSLWTARRFWFAGLKTPAIAAVALAMLLVSPISWTHHWVWFVVVIAALLEPAIGHWIVRGALVAATVELAYSRLVWSVPNENDAEYHHHGWQIVRANSYAGWAVLALAVLAFAAWRLRPSPDATPDTRMAADPTEAVPAAIV